MTVQMKNSITLKIILGFFMKSHTVFLIDPDSPGEIPTSQECAWVMIAGKRKFTDIWPYSWGDTL